VAAEQILPLRLRRWRASAQDDQRPGGRSAQDDKGGKGAHRSARRKARKYALDVLFAADIQGVDPAAILAQGLVTTPLQPPDYTRQLVEGVVDHQAAIDADITAHLKPGWTLARMPAVDRALARIAVYEVTETDTPPSVALSEAVELAAELSTGDSPGFLTGLLGAVVADGHSERSARRGAGHPARRRASAGVAGEESFVSGSLGCRGDPSLRSG
jgi:N utilization substance protein B